jgi:AmmeMemoRadiSam system protein B/AmmeMemoRadiSam system protein A
VTTARQPAVAGTFYPADPTELEGAVRGYLAGVHEDPDQDPERPAKALIVPHAGFVYSGPIAASAYRQLAGVRDEIRRVVLLGPSHRLALRGLAVTSADSFETPLGSVPIDRQATERILELPQVRVLDAAHQHEHSLEVQLPFLQCVLGEFALVPISVGDATSEEVAAVLDALWGGDETLIVISSDLSHYHDYATARSLDEQTVRVIEDLRFQDLRSEAACGCVPTRGLLAMAKQRGLAARTLDVRNSGDTAGPADRVVGYGAWAFEPRSSSESCYYGARERRLLLGVARRSLAEGLRAGRGELVSVPDHPPKLREHRASFVTLHRDGELRGCTGTLEAFRALVVDVADRAFAAGYRDPRFPPLREEEIPRVEIEISVLSPLEALSFQNQEDLLAQIRPGVDGLLLCAGAARGTLLPSVWQSLPERHTVLAHLKRKAGLPDDHWSPDLVVHRYTTEILQEAPAGRVGVSKEGS